MTSNVTNSNNADLTNENTPTSINEKKRKSIEPRSWVWLNFAIKLNPKSAKCRVCQKEITIYNGSPSEVSKHLINEHNITQNTINAERPTKKFRLDFESDNSDDETSKKVSPTKYQAPESKVKKIQRKLLQFIIACNLPFNIVDAKEFQDLINEIKNEYFKLPCRQTLRYTLLPNMVNYSLLFFCFVIC